jgi:RNase P/RNase MRP subunit p29
VLAILPIAWIVVAGELRADVIVLNNGEQVEGSIVDATRNTVVVRRAIGGMRQMPIADIAEVRIDLAQGAPIAGRIVSWADGVHEVRSGGEVVRIREGRILSREPVQQASGQEPGGARARVEAPRTAAPAPEAPAARDLPAASAAGPKTAVEESAAAEPPAAEIPAEEPAARRAAAGGARERTGTADTPEGTAAAAPAAAGPSARENAAPAERAAGEARPRQTADRSGEATGRSSADDAAATAARAAEGTVAEKAAAEETAAGSAAAGSAAEPASDESRTAAALAAPEAGGEHEPVSVKATVDPAVAGPAGMIFKIELSRPAEQTVVLIYGTVDGTARAGQDYEARQGVVTLAPGTSSAEVHVPLIGHQAPRGDARFELFLAADPKVAEIADPRITATIPGDD